MSEFFLYDERIEHNSGIFCSPTHLGIDFSISGETESESIADDQIPKCEISSM